MFAKADFLLKKSIYIIFILFANLSCIGLDENIPVDYRKQIDVYKKDQVLIYQSKINSDTIKITRIDSTSTSHGPTNFPFKNIYVEIQHIPNNYWNNGIVLRKSTNRYDSIAHQKLLVIMKSQRSNNKMDDIYAFPVEYRDFLGALNMENLIRNGVDTIEPIRVQHNKTLSDTSVVRVFWNIDKGMIGYEKKNGLMYNLIN